MNYGQEPMHDVAQLGHFEIFTPKPDESFWFFREILGMEETDRQGQSVYMRAWGDYDHCTLKITEAKEAGLGHVGLRAWSPQALDRRVQALEAAGYGKGWIDGDIGHGRVLGWRIRGCQDRRACVARPPIFHYRKRSGNRPAARPILAAGSPRSLVAPEHLAARPGIPPMAQPACSPRSRRNSSSPPMP